MKTSIQSAFSLAAVLLVGSCAAPVDMKDPAVFADGAANHPISVGPGYRSLMLAVGPDGAPESSVSLDSFVAEYLARGNGSLTVSAPRGASSSDSIERVSEMLVRMGVPRARLLVGTHDATANDGRIELGYVAYVAHTDPCGDWSHDADETADNLPMPDFGCAVQHNIAAMVADPRDLVSPRTMAPSDAVRRDTLVKQYETGQITAAQKTQEQSGAVSSVAAGGQ